MTSKRLFNSFIPQKRLNPPKTNFWLCPWLVGLQCTSACRFVAVWQVLWRRDAVQRSCVHRSTRRSQDHYSRLPVRVGDEARHKSELWQRSLRRPRVDNFALVWREYMRVLYATFRKVLHLSLCCWCSINQSITHWSHLPDETVMKWQFMITQTGQWDLNPAQIKVRSGAILHWKDGHSLYTAVYLASIV